MTEHGLASLFLHPVLSQARSTEPGVRPTRLSNLAPGSHRRSVGPPQVFFGGGGLPYDFTHAFRSRLTPSLQPSATGKVARERGGGNGCFRIINKGWRGDAILKGGAGLSCLFFRCSFAAHFRLQMTAALGARIGQEMMNWQSGSAALWSGCWIRTEL